MVKLRYPVSRPAMRSEDVVAMAKAMSWLSTGPVVAEFEAALARASGYDHAVAVSSCTAALTLTIVAKFLGSAGTRIGVPALTFTATAAAVYHAGATPVFLDVDPESGLLMPPNKYPPWVASGNYLDAVIPVDLYGQTVPETTLGAWRSIGAKVIVDGAHSVGDVFTERESPTCLSFYATKNMTTAGEGGAVLTQDAELASAIRCLSLHGLSQGAWARYAGGTAQYRVEQIGFKANMTDPQAACGLEQLKRLPALVEARWAAADAYDDFLRDVPQCLAKQIWTRANGVPHLFPVLLGPGIHRDALIERLRARGIGTGIHYRALTKEPAWTTFAVAGECQVAEDMGERVLSLPLYADLTRADIEDIVGCLKHELRAIAKEPVHVA